MTLNGPGTLTNATSLTLTTTTINAPLVNQGLLLVRGNASNINGTFTTVAGSTLRLQAENSANHSILNVAGGFTNNAAIELTSIGLLG